MKKEKVEVMEISKRKGGREVKHGNEGERWREISDRECTYRWRRIKRGERR